MVEAAMVLPLVVLIMASLLLVMLHVYDFHYRQIEIHREMLSSWNSPPTAYAIQKKKLETSSRISGAVNQVFHQRKVYHCYCLNPSECIRLGEMITFDDQE